MPGKHHVNHPRNRTVGGPTPASIAILAKPPTKHDPHWRAVQKQRNDTAMVEAEKEQERLNLRAVRYKWMDITDCEIMQNRVDKQIDRAHFVRDEDLNQKRQKLKEMLLAEEESFWKEFEQMQETPLERDARLRMTHKQIQERKLLERLQEVQIKLDAQFFMQSDEIREEVSKQLTKKVAKERLDSIIYKRQQTEEKRTEDTTFDGLWEGDYQTKRTREEAEAYQRHVKNMEHASVLHKQMNANEMKQKLLLEAKMADELMNREQTAMFLEEKRLQQQIKREKQGMIRDALDSFCQLKNDTKEKFDRVENAMDMKIVEHAKQEAERVTVEEEITKRENAREYKLYLAYMREEDEKEKKEQKESEKLLHEKQMKKMQMDDEKELNLRLHQDKLEKEMRATQKEQVLEKKEIKRQQDEQLRQYYIASDTQAQRNRMEEEQRVVKKRQDILEYRQELKEQIAFNVEKRKLARQRELEEREALRLAEEQYQQRVKEILSRPPPLNKHPMRYVIDSQRFMQPFQPNSDSQHHSN